MGMSSVAHAAVRKVHRESPVAAVSYFNSRVAKYAGSPAWPAAQAFRQQLERYIAWDAAIGQPLMPDGIDVKLTVPFGAGNAVRAITHVVVEDGAIAAVEARIVLWDELRLNQRSAEMIALPILEATDAGYGAGTTTRIQVWQVAQNQPVTIAPGSAQTRRGEIQTLISGL
jgi:hypothetical protein